MNLILIATVIVVLIIISAITVISIGSHIARGTCKKQGHDWDNGKCKRCSVDKEDYENAIEWARDGWKEHCHHPGPDDSYAMRATFSNFGAERFADHFSYHYERKLHRYKQEQIALRRLKKIFKKYC